MRGENNIEEMRDLFSIISLAHNLLAHDERQLSEQCAPKFARVECPVFGQCLLRLHSRLSG